MYAAKEEDQGDRSQILNIQTYQEQLFVRQQHQAFISDVCGGGSRGGLAFPDAPPPIQLSLPPIHAFNPVSFSTNSILDHDSFLGPLPRPPPPVSPFAALFNRRGSDNPRTLSDQHGGHDGLCQSASQFGFQAEFGNMTAQEMIDAKALAASKSHSEAERRRRERINNHLAKLRSLLPNTTKTDKASLLAEVIQHVKELKRQTTKIEQAGPVPTEVDELSVDESEEEGKFVIKASLCCEDRPELLPDLIKTLKALKLRTLKAEITTLGGRVRNVLFITGDDDSNNKNNNPQRQQHCSISSIKEGLKAVMERTTADDSSAGSIKRQRTNITILERSHE